MGKIWIKTLITITITANILQQGLIYAPATKTYYIEVPKTHIEQIRDTRGIIHLKIYVEEKIEDRLGG